MSYDDSELDGDEYGDEIGLADNEARVIVTLTREDEGVDGFIEMDQGMDFDPGDTENSPGTDVLRLAAEMVLVAAGYDDEEVQRFLDNAPRGPIQMEESG